MNGVVNLLYTLIKNLLKKGHSAKVLTLIVSIVTIPFKKSNKSKNIISFFSAWEKVPHHKIMTTIGHDTFTSCPLLGHDT